MKRWFRSGLKYPCKRKGHLDQPFKFTFIYLFTLATYSPHKHWLFGKDLSLLLNKTKTIITKVDVTKPTIFLLFTTKQIVGCLQFRKVQYGYILLCIQFVIRFSLKTILVYKDGFILELIRFCYLMGKVIF